MLEKQLSRDRQPRWDEGFGIVHFVLAMDALDGDVRFLSEICEGYSSRTRICAALRPNFPGAPRQGLSNEPKTAPIGLAVVEICSMRGLRVCNDRKGDRNGDSRWTEPRLWVLKTKMRSIAYRTMAVQCNLFPIGSTASISQQLV